MTVRGSIYQGVQRVYNRTFRDHLPRKIKVLNGVAVPEAALFDRTDWNPDRKSPNINGLRSRIQHGDNIGIVGGGKGTTAVVAARATGPEGHVVVYEAASDRIEYLEQIMDMNEVSGQVEIKEGIVAKAEDVYGVPSERIVPPENLKGFDVLELDCEGAEVSILENIIEIPREVIVETHPGFGAQDADVLSALEARGLKVIESTSLNGTVNESVYVTTREDSV